MKPARLDPRSKMILACSLAVILVAAGRWPVLAITAVGSLAAVGCLGLTRPGIQFLKGLAPAVFGFFAIAWVALDFSSALTAGLRLLALGTVFFLFFQTTPPKDLSDSLVGMGMPYPFAFVLTVSMEFIPVLARRAANIRDAQRARGIPLSAEWKALRHLPALLGPLLIQAFKLADEMAEALEARGFGSPGRRKARPAPFRPLDWLVSLMSLAALVLGFLFGFF